MKDASAKLLAKANRAIKAAETLVADDEPEFAIGRAYYAMFYVAEALLYEQGLHSKKHAGVSSMFGEHFANLKPIYLRTMLGRQSRKLANSLWPRRNFS